MRRGRVCEDARRAAATARLALAAFTRGVPDPWRCSGSSRRGSFSAPPAKAPRPKGPRAWGSVPETRSATSSATIAANLGVGPGALALANGRPSDAAVCAASTSRSWTTSMWSLTNPTGTTTTADGRPSGSGSPFGRAPSASAARWSLTSGSSQGTLGGPLRLWKTRSKGRVPPRTRSVMSRDASRSSAAYLPPTAPGTAVPFDTLPLTAAMATGTLCAVNTRRAPG